MRIVVFRDNAERGPFALLLLAIVSYITVFPFLPGSDEDGVLFRSAWSLLTFAGLLATARSRRVLIVALALALPSLLLNWGVGNVDLPGLPVADPLSTALFLSFTALVVLRGILTRRQITTDMILGAVNVFLLIALVFCQLHVAAEIAQPGSYRLGPQPVSALKLTEDQDLQQTMLYFSLTTLTTLGYGDIRPVTHGARMLSTLEAVIGQLFVAILIAYMVSTLVSTRASQVHGPSARSKREPDAAAPPE